MYLLTYYYDYDDDDDDDIDVIAYTRTYTFTDIYIIYIYTYIQNEFVFWFSMRNNKCLYERFDRECKKREKETPIMVLSSIPSTSSFFNPSSS